MVAPAIRTKFTELAGITTPVISASMAGPSGGALAAQVTLGGGFGFFGSPLDSVERLRQEIEIARTTFEESIGPQDILPIGVGFIGWVVDKAEAVAKAQIALLFEYRVKAVWLSFGDNLSSWIQYIRSLNSATHRILIFVQVTSVSEALTATNEWKVDVLVAQGIEGGGHGASKGLPLLTLLPTILSNLPPDSPPIIGAGGLANGSQVAGLLTLGASGAVLGTRFLLSKESRSTDAQRKILLEADSYKSIRTLAFDEVRDTMGWPEGIDGRGIQNATSDDYEKGMDVSTLRKKYEEASAKGETDRLVVWAGTGVGLMNNVLPAKDIVKELHEECLRRLSDARNLVAW